MQISEYDITNEIGENSYTSIKQLKAIFGIPNWVQLTPSEIELASMYPVFARI
jgi:hypothetical protein